jgi:hypothetical protein
MEAKKDNLKVITPPFRVSFPALIKPRAFQNNEPTYSVEMLFSKGTDISQLKAAAAAAAKKKWPGEVPKNLRSPFKDGNEKNYDGYKDVTVVVARSKNKPGLVDQDLNEIIEAGAIYGGCWARASITAYAYDKAGNRGVSFGLQNLQKVKDDTAFSGRANAKDEFETIETDSAQSEFFEEKSADGFGF